MELLKQQIEALIFCSEQAISLEEIAASLKLSFDWDLKDEEIIEAIEVIQSKYTSDDFAFELLEISEGFQFMTKKQYYPAISALIQHKAKKKLSVSQMETLAIIAYRQPIAKSEIEHIRGVSCDYAIQKLLEKELIEISGKSDGPGRPVLYSTSKLFMDYFGIKSVKDLPQLKDIHVEQNEIGTASDLSEAFDVVPDGQEGENSNAGDFNPAEGSVIASEEVAGEETIQSIVAAEETSVEAGAENPVSEGIEELTDANDLMNLPDRKAIFMESETKVEEINTENPEMKDDSSVE
ncbi:MAG: SMC-Scp complex subunit ScpB [Bacteroidia bacterium]